MFVIGYFIVVEEPEENIKGNGEHNGEPLQYSKEISTGYEIT